MNGVVDWYVHDFVGRSLAGNYSVEQIVRSVGAPAASRLVAALSPRMPQQAMVKIAEVILGIDGRIVLPVLVGLALLMMVKDNKKALIVVHGMMAGGTALIGVVTLAFQLGLVGPVPFMILVGFGAYLAYVPFGCVLFDRLIATVGFVATAGFMIYVTDAFGYVGSVSVMLYKNFGEAKLD